jgi:serine/threonine protein kinase
MLIGRLPFSNSDVKLLFQKIIHENADMPLFLSAQSKSILNQLLEKNPNKRIGASIQDFKELQTHSFFSQIDWNLMLQKKLEPPFKPLVSSETDTRYFEKEFTGENVQLTPTTSEDMDFGDSINYSNIGNLKTSLKYFDSFSYYGSKTSLNSQQIQNYISNTSLDKQDSHSLLSNEHHRSQMSLNDNKLIDEQAIQNSAIHSIMPDNIFYPYLVQYTDNTGHLYESQTYAAASNGRGQEEQNMFQQAGFRLNNEQLQNFHIFNHSLFANLTNPFYNNFAHLSTDNNVKNVNNNHHVLNMVIDEQGEN